MCLAALERKAVSHWKVLPNLFKLLIALCVDWDFRLNSTSIIETLQRLCYNIVKKYIRFHNIVASHGKNVFKSRKNTFIQWSAISTSSSIFTCNIEDVTFLKVKKDPIMKSSLDYFQRFILAPNKQQSSVLIVAENPAKSHYVQNGLKDRIRIWYLQYVPCRKESI